MKSSLLCLVFNANTFIIYCQVIAWASVCSILVFGTLRFIGLIRVDESVEEDGLDHSEHGAPKPVKVQSNVQESNDIPVARFETSTAGD